MEQIFQQLLLPLSTFLSTFSPWIILTVIIIACAIVIKCAYQRKTYMKSEYFAKTGRPYGIVRRDVGMYGEHLISNQLAQIEGTKRFLFNCYVPKSDGTTTEIDVILLHSSGIYVFESKNFSGWIFGSEKQKMWTQTFPNGHKERFYNPIMQNNTHIKWLKNTLKECDDSAFRSIVVFSERCQLKKIELISDHHKVVKRNNLLRAVMESVNHQMFSDDEIESVYQKLYPMTNVSQETRQSHIDAIAKR